MGYLTKYGSYWGVVPNTAGNIYWVAPAASYTLEGRTYGASDQNDGLSPERALLTADRAMDLVTANVGDVIVLLPGTHSYSATVAVDVAGVTITGIPIIDRKMDARMPAMGKRRATTVTNTATAGIIFTVTAANVEISHLAFLPAAAGGRAVSFSNLADRLYIHDCVVAMVATASVTTYGFTHPADVTDPVEDVLISHCYFQSGLSSSSGANGSAVNALGSAVGMTIENSTFELKGTAAWANAILSSNAGSSGLVVRDVDFINPTSATTVITTAINSSGQTDDGSTIVYRTYFPAGTDGVTATAMADIVLAESYIANSSGGTLMLNA